MFLDRLVTIQAGSMPLRYADVTRPDVTEFLELAATMHLEPQVEEYPLAAANTALIDLKFRPVTAAKVLTIGS
jgi:alcohol dehydrogenase, propanol-preferring